MWFIYWIKGKLIFEIAENCRFVFVIEIVEIRKKKPDRFFKLSFKIIKILKPKPKPR
jgi:hypothetical protein